MTHALLELLSQRCVSGLQRRMVTSCSKYAESYRVMGPPFPGPWTFDWHPWLRGMHDCEAEIMCGQKCAQVGYTELCLNKSFFTIDIRGSSVLYLLPAAHPDAKDFSTSRFDAALSLSAHLRDLFSDVKNIGHKQAGSANLFIRGSRSRSQLKSIPVELLIFDELDEMVQENVPLAMERASGQLRMQAVMISTPTIDGYGVNAYFRDSTQQHFMFRCPHCSKYTELSFPECIVITAEDHYDPKIKNSHFICKECNGVLAHEQKREFLRNGMWSPSYQNRTVEGFYVNQMYSSAQAGQAHKLAEAYLKSLTNPADEQEFHNSKLGITHVVDGAQVTDAEIADCLGAYKMQTHASRRLVTMGVDIGKWIHFVIEEWTIIPDNHNDLNLAARCRVLKVGKVLEFEELDPMMRQFGVLYTVLDANPETRKAREFTRRWAGRARICYYSRSASAREIIGNDEERAIKVDRTSWLDVAQTRYRNGTITLPIDIPQEFKDHVRALVRVYEKDADGNPVGRYIKPPTAADHYAHARNYSEMALPLAVGMGGPQNMSEGPV